MTQAIFLGAQLCRITNLYMPNPVSDTAEVLQTFLIDDVKGALTGYTGFFTFLFCEANGDELSPHSLLTASMTVGLQMFVPS